MKWKMLWLVKSDPLKVLVLSGLAFYIAFIPHLDYPYPIHIDEWVHLSFTKGLMAEGSLDIVEPFTGDPIRLENRLEFGFQLPLGIFQRITGIDWNAIFRYSPSLVFMVTVFFVYLFARKEGYGWQAALLACLVPTSVRILGPAFLVPVALGLVFLPLMLYLAFNCRKWWSYLLLFVFTGFLISMHGPSIISIVIILLPYIVMNSRNELGHSLKTASALFLPFLLVLPFAFEVVSTLFQSLVTRKLPIGNSYIPQLLSDYGYLPIILAFIGVIGLTLRGGIKNISLVSGLVLLLGMLALFQVFGFGIDSIYLRGLLFGTLLMGVLGGAGLREIGTLRLPGKIVARLRFPVLTKYLGTGLCIIIIGFTLAIAIPARLNESYYHTIDQTDYDAFVWIRDNIGEEYGRAIVDPWKATAFTAITGKHVYTRTHLGPTAIGAQTQHFLRDGSVDTELLRENQLSIVYTRIYDGQQNMEFGSANPDLVEVKRNIYLLKQ